MRKDSKFMSVVEKLGNINEKLNRTSGAFDDFFDWVNDNLVEQDWPEEKKEELLGKAKTVLDYIKKITTSQKTTIPGFYRSVQRYKSKKFNDVMELILETDPVSIEK